MKLAMSTSGLGTRRRSRPPSSSAIGVVAASRMLAATPSVPLARMFHAAHRPSRDSDSTPSTSTRRPATDERQEEGEGHERQLEHQPAEHQATAVRPARRTTTTSGARRRRTPRTPLAGVATMANTKSTVAASLHSGASRCSGLVPVEVEPVRPVAVLAASCRHGQVPGDPARRAPVRGVAGRTPAAHGEQSQEEPPDSRR